MALIRLIKNNSLVSFPRWKGIPSEGYKGLGGEVTLEQLKELDKEDEIEIEVLDPFMITGWASGVGLWVVSPRTKEI